LDVEIDMIMFIVAHPGFLARSLNIAPDIRAVFCLVKLRGQAGIEYDPPDTDLVLFRSFMKGYDMCRERLVVDGVFAIATLRIEFNVVALSMERTRLGSGPRRRIGSSRER
jgi:hypothetical protein